MRLREAGGDGGSSSLLIQTSAECPPPSCSRGHAMDLSPMGPCPGPGRRAPPLYATELCPGDPTSDCHRAKAPPEHVYKELGMLHGGCLPRDAGLKAMTPPRKALGVWRLGEHRKGPGLGFQLLDSVLTSCATLDDCFNLYGPLLPHLENKSIILGDCLGPSGFVTPPRICQRDSFCVSWTGSTVRMTYSNRQLFFCLLASGGAQIFYDVMGSRGDWQPVPSASGPAWLAPAQPLPWRSSQPHSAVTLPSGKCPQDNRSL